MPGGPSGKTCDTPASPGSPTGTLKSLHYFPVPHWYPSDTKVSLDVSTGILTPLQYLPMALQEI